MDIITQHYVDVVSPTWNYAKRQESVREEILNAALGVVTEGGEVGDVVKKMLFHKERNRRAELVEEIGDVYYYLAALQHLFGLETEEILTANKAKLFERYEIDGK